MKITKRDYGIIIEHEYADFNQYTQKDEYYSFFLNSDEIDQLYDYLLHYYGDHP